MTPELIAGITGSAISFAVGRFPGLNTAFAKMDSNIKSLLMIAATVLAATGIFLWNCHGAVSSCVNGLDWRTWVQTVGAAVVLNTSTHHILPEAQAVKDAKMYAAAP